MTKESIAKDMKLGKIGFILVMGAFIAIAPVSTDIYLPALPGMETDLQAAPGSGALTMSAWVLGVAIGQILAGPLMDRYGRKLPLAVGTLIYVAASVGCALSRNMEMLYAFRFLAAFFAAFSLVAPQACVRDIARGNEGARLLSRLALVQGIVPLLAPALGGMALEFVSWRAMFWTMAVYGIFSVFLVYFIPDQMRHSVLEDEAEEIEKTGKKENFSHLLLSFVKSYQIVWQDKSFRFYGSIWMLQGIFIFSYLSAAPSLFEKSFGLTPAQYGILFGATAFIMTATTQVNAALLKKFSTSSLLRTSTLIGFVLSCLFVAVAFISGGTLLHGDEAARSYWFLPVAGTLLILLCCFVMIGPNACACALLRKKN